MDVVGSFPLLNFGNILSTYYKGRFVRLFLPPKKKFTQNAPSQRKGHWLGSIYSVELASWEGLKTVCVLRGCQCCDSWSGRGRAGSAALSQPNVSCLRNLILYPLPKECGLWNHTVSSPFSFLCSFADVYVCRYMQCIKTVWAKHEFNHRCPIWWQSFSAQD